MAPLLGMVLWEYIPMRIHPNDPYLSTYLLTYNMWVKVWYFVHTFYLVKARWK